MNPLNCGVRTVLAALAAVLLPASVAAHSCPVAIGSAPTIMGALASRVAAQASAIAVIPPPFGPPQGDLDPGLRQFLDGSRDFAFLTREISEPDLAAFRRGHQGRAPVILPIAAGAWNRFGSVDAVVVIVNRANPLRSLRLQQIDGIFSATRWRAGPMLTHWRQLGLGGALGRQPIRIMGSGGWAGVESARALTLRRHVLSMGSHVGRWRAAPDGGEEAQVVERVGADAAAIGFTGAGHLNRTVRAIAIEGVAASGASAASGRYPLLRTVDLLFDAPEGHIDSRLAALAEWLLSEKGQQLIAQQGDFAALPKFTLHTARLHLSGLGRASACP